MMVRRDEFLALGGFYEPLFMYGEEADYCLRAPGRVVLHPAARSATSTDMPPGRRGRCRGCTTRRATASSMRRGTCPPLRWRARSRPRPPSTCSRSRSCAAVTSARAPRGWVEGLRAMRHERAARAGAGERRAAARQAGGRPRGRGAAAASGTGVSPDRCRVHTDRCPACCGPPGRPAIQGIDRMHGSPATSPCTCAPPAAAGGQRRSCPDSSAPLSGGTSPTACRAAHAARGRDGLFRWRYWRALRRPPLCVLRERPAGRLLDVGSGRGDLGVVACAPGWRRDRARAVGRGGRSGQARGVESSAGTLDDARPARAGFDAAVFQHSLEHVGEPHDALCAARELLVPGGLALVIVPNFGSWQARRFGSAWFHLDLPRHRSHFTRDGLRALVGRAGLTASDGHVDERRRAADEPGVPALGRRSARPGAVRRHRGDPGRGAVHGARRSGGSRRRPPPCRRKGVGYGRGLTWALPAAISASAPPPRWSCRSPRSSA